MDSNKSEHSLESIASTSKNISEDTSARLFSRKRKATEQGDQRAKEVASGERDLDQDELGRRQLNRFKCHDCVNIFFSHSRYWREHIKRHHLDVNATLCCGKLFKSGVSLHSHRKDTHNDSSLMCIICGSLSKNLECYLIHMKDKHEELGVRGRIFCPICYKEMNRDYFDHKHTHNLNREKPFGCSDCHKRFINKHDIEQHILMHILDSTGQKHYKCNVCDKSYTQRASLTVHINEKKHTSPASSLPDISVIVGNYLKENRNGKETDLSWKCDCCKEKFIYKRYLRTHIKQHHVERNICKICKQMFVLKKNLHDHMKKIHNASPIICMICGTFSENIKFHQRHEKEAHNLQLDYSICSFCNKAIVQDNYNKHIRVHVKTKDCPYTCPVCNKTFTLNKSYWEQHMLSHIAKKFYKCNECDSSFVSKKGFQQHWKNKHTGPVPPQPDPVDFIQNYLRKRNESAIG